MQFGRKKTLMDRAHDYVEQFSETVLPQLEQAWEQAVDKAGPALTDARDKAGPLLADGRAMAAEKAAAGAALAAEKSAEARDKAAPLLAEARANAADKAAAAAALASERAAEGRDLAAARVNQLRGVEPEPRGGRLKKVLLLGGLLAIGGVIFSKLRQKDEDAHWQSSYVPPAPPAPPAAPAPEAVSADEVVTEEPPAVSDDTGGGAPGEAISDAVEEPQDATTPDAPAEIIDIDDVPQKK